MNLLMALRLAVCWGFIIKHNKNYMKGEMQPCWWSPPTPQPDPPLFSPPPLPYLAALPAGSAPFSRCIGRRRCPAPVRVFTPGTTPSPRQRCNPTCRWSTSAEASTFPPARAFPKRGGNRRAFGSEGIFSLSLFPLPPWGCEGKRRSGSWFWAPAAVWMWR